MHSCIIHFTLLKLTLALVARKQNNELEEFKSLGLTTNARQVEHSLQQKIDNIQEDNRAIEALCAEAAKTRDDIADKLDKVGAALSSMTLNVLKGIVSAMNELEVDTGSLSTFAKSKSNASKAPPAMNGSHSADTQKDKAVAADAKPADVAPKLTWATKSDGEEKKAEVKSLLHIQNEELSSKE